MALVVKSISPLQRICVEGDPTTHPIPAVVNPGDVVVRCDTGVEQHFSMQENGIQAGANYPAAHDAALITSGVIATARLGTGTPSGSTVLVGNGTWGPGVPALAHATSHHSGGSDALALSSIAGTLTAAQHGTFATGDTHPVYALDSDLAAHEAAADPHTGYQRESEKGVASGYASLDASTLVPIAQVPLGSSASTTCVGNDARLSDSRTPLAHTHVAGDITGTAVLTADSRLSDARTPTAHASTHNAAGSDAMAIDAAAGTGSLRTIGTGALTACAGNDSRLSDSRTPTAHASTHNAGGSDAMAIDAVAGTGSLRTIGTGALTACAGNDSRLSDARTPTAHAASHKAAGSDSIPLDTLAAPTDITALNASTTAHGLMPKGTGSTATFYRSDMTQAAPTASVAISSADIPFTDGDTMRRVTVTDAGITALSKIVGSIRRPDIEDSADPGYIYLHSIVKVAAGSFDMLIACLGWGFDDPLLTVPPNETIKFFYTFA